MEIMLFLRELVGGTPLTWEEVNDNFTNLRDGVYEVNDKVDGIQEALTIVDGKVTTNTTNIATLDGRVDDVNTGLADLTEAVNTSYKHQIVLISNDDYVLEAEDGSQTGLDPLLLFTSNTSVVLTVPLDAAVTFPIGAEVNFAQYGDGSITVAGSPGVTVNSLGDLVESAGNNAKLTLVKIAANEWLLSGDLV